MSLIFSGLTTASVSVLTTAQLNALSTADYAAISDQLRALTTSQIAGDKCKSGCGHHHSKCQCDDDQSIEQRANYRSSRGIDDGAVGALTTDQVRMGLTTDQIVRLTTKQVSAFSTDQVQSLDDRSGQEHGDA